MRSTSDSSSLRWQTEFPCVGAVQALFVLYAYIDPCLYTPFKQILERFRYGAKLHYPDIAWDFIVDYIKESVVFGRELMLGRFAGRKRQVVRFTDITDLPESVFTSDGEEEGEKIRILIQD